ncbi:unnamed protein product [Citrullus colocynthis]|uniref:Cytochrome P450 71A1-like n=1 Tax=Citrullus colocynthis TaxID=252529 RepID=A0ABP0Z978_9ROSI
MFLKLGRTPTLVVSSPKMAREVMKTHDLKFSNRPQTTARKFLLYGCQDMAFSQYGEYWRRAKKMCVLELLSAKRVESFQYVRDEEVGLLIDRIRKSCDVVCGDECVNLKQMFMSTSNNKIARCVLGEKFEDENGKSRFGDVSRRILVLLAAFCVGDFFPAFGWVDVVRGFIRELKTTFRILDGFFNKVIEEHRTKMNVGKSDEGKDFVDIMLQLQQDDMFDYLDFSLDRLKAILLLPDGSVLDVEEENGLTVCKKNPLHLKPVPFM